MGSDRADASTAAGELVRASKCVEALQHLITFTKSVQQGDASSTSGVMPVIGRRPTTNPLIVTPYNSTFGVALAGALKTLRARQSDSTAEASFLQRLVGSVGFRHYDRAIRG